MPKRKERDSETQHQENGRRACFCLCMTELDLVKRPNLSPTPKQPSTFRKSARLQARIQLSIKEQEGGAHLPSPDSSLRQGRSGRCKRKAWSEELKIPAENNTGKRRKVERGEARLNPAINTHNDPVAHWVSNDAVWPSDYILRGRTMATDKSSKQRSESSHASDRLARMNEHKIYMDDSRSMCKASRMLCDKLLRGNRPPAGFPVYPAEKRQAVLQRVATASESRIQRDILPIVVPSVENLGFCGILSLDRFGDEMHGEWTKAETMGGKHPKPDYVAGLRQSAFDSKTWEKL